MEGFASPKQYESLLEIEECIRFYPPDISELKNSEYVFTSPKTIALYIHIPFCKSPCGFCPFNQYQYDEAKYARYFSALEKEIQLIMQKIDFSLVNISSVWVGGGTPLDLSCEQLEMFLNIVTRNFQTSNVKEFTIEGKPVKNMITPEKLDILKKYGVNRISLGIQSTQEKYLRLLGRNYSFEQACDTINLITSCGFKLNLDMIYNIPGETEEEVKIDVEQIAKLNVEHISWFHYISHTGTPLTNRFNSERVNLCRDKTQFFSMYESVLAIMQKYGYSQYTPYYYTNNEQCQYHIDRWKMPQLDVIGLGAGAFSTYNNWIYCNAHNLDLYISELSEGRLPISAGKKVSPKDAISKLVVLGCKFFDVSLEEFEEYAGVNFENIYQNQIAELEKLGLITISEGFLRCTKKGQAFNNAVAASFSDEKYFSIGQPQPLLIRKEGL